MSSIEELLLRAATIRIYSNPEKPPSYQAAADLAVKEWNLSPLQAHTLLLAAADHWAVPARLRKQITKKGYEGHTDEARLHTLAVCVSTIIEKDTNYHLAPPEDPGKKG